MQPFYHFLENAVTNKKEIPFDAHIFEYIKRNHGRELQTLADENKVGLFMDVKKSFVVISPVSDKERSLKSHGKTELEVWKIFCSASRKLKFHFPLSFLMKYLSGGRGSVAEKSPLPML